MFDRNSPFVRAAIVFVGAAVLLGLLILWRPSDQYPWFMAGHIVAVISWMAGMLYLPRLFVYHAKSAPGSEQSETFKVMERRLLSVIINPAMVATWVLGLWLAWDAALLSEGWLHTKIALVVVLSAIHGLYARWVRQFADDRNTGTQRFYRIISEVPTVLMIAIVVMVVVKPL